MSKRVSRSPRAHKRESYIKREPTKLSVLFTQYKIDDRVIVKLDSAVHKGMPFARILNRVGLVKEVIGKSIDKMYTILIDKKFYKIYSAHLRHARI